MPDFSLEQALGARCGGLVCGIDEVGRGPLAGPVVAAAAVILDPAALPPGLDDSKKLSAGRREALFTALWPSGPAVVIGVGAASAREIDAINILRATELAMNRAVRALGRRLGAPPAGALVDGNRVPPGLPCVAEAVVKGDGRSLSIAAASVVAKVLRDRLMAALDRRHPGYGWAGNAGYPTIAHRKAMARLGLSPHHRRTFNAQLPLFD